MTPVRHGGDDRTSLNRFSTAKWLAPVLVVVMDDGCKLEALGLFACADWETSRDSFSVLISSTGDEGSECMFPPDKESL